MHPFVQVQVREGNQKEMQNMDVIMHYISVIF
jgi:hypothetical protein